MLRALLLSGMAWQVAAQSGPADPEKAARDLIQNAAQALAERRATGFLEAFDRPLAERLRKPVEALVRDYDIERALEFRSAAGDERGAALSVDWKLDLTAREGQRDITHRQKRLECRVAVRDGAPRIVSLDGAFEGAGFFAPPDVDGAWDLLESAARALSERDKPVAGFLAFFDSKLPGYEALRNGAEGLAAQGEIDSSIALSGNEGTDAARSITVDWTLEVVHADTSMRILRREADLTLEVERRGKGWLVTAIAPLDFFAN